MIPLLMRANSRSHVTEARKGALDRPARPGRLLYERVERSDVSVPSDLFRMYPVVELRILLRQTDVVLG